MTLVLAISSKLRSSPDATANSEVDRNPANINHRLCLHGRHSEHARADRRRYRPSNLSGCFHPHFAGMTVAGHFVTGYRRRELSV
jgi:hypothetical protein